MCSQHAGIVPNGLTTIFQKQKILILGAAACLYNV